MVWLSSLPHVSMALPTESMFSFSDDALHVERSISAVMVCRVKSILISFENEEPFGEYDDHSTVLVSAFALPAKNAVSSTTSMTICLVIVVFIVVTLYLVSFFPLMM